MGIEGRTSEKVNPAKLIRKMKQKEENKKDRTGK